MKVRPAESSDRPAVAALIAAMGGHEDVLAGADPLLAFDRLIGDPIGRALIAESDGVVVGYAEILSRPSTLHDRDEAWLGALAVDPSRRSEGIGAALLAAADREAVLLGCSEMVLESSTWRTDSHRFYGREGFTDAGDARRFTRPVAKPAASESLETRFLALAARAASLARALAARPAEPSGKATDVLIETRVIPILRELDVPVLGEETGLTGDDPGPGQAWIALDPIDGTRNYRARLPPYSISIGLVRDGTPLAGLVVDLSSGTRWTGIVGQGAWRDGRPICPRAGTVLGTPSPRPGDSLTVPPGFDRIRISGCTSIDLCHVADGSLAAFTALDRGDIYVQDIAAAAALLKQVSLRLLDRRRMTIDLSPTSETRVAVVTEPGEGGSGP